MQDDIVAEQSFQGLEFRNGLLHTVFTLVVGTIDEATPHDDALVGFECVGQHVGTVGMGTSEIARAGLSFAVGFHEETAEIGDELVDFLSFPLPPTGYRFVERVGSLGIAECHRSGKVDAEEGANAIRTQDVGNLFNEQQIVAGEHLGRCVHIVEHAAVDAYRRVGAGILLDELAVDSHLVVPEDAFAGISSLYAAVEIVPMVKQAQREGRSLSDG